MNNITPFGNNILVLPTEIKTIVSVKNTSKCDYGKVIAIGKDVKEIKVGEVIGFVNHGLLALEVEKTKLYFIPEDANFILGTFTNE
jgi:co-chaperonin GroES (HSP10)